MKNVPCGEIIFRGKASTGKPGPAFERDAYDNAR